MIPLSVLQLLPLSAPQASLGAVDGAMFPCLEELIVVINEYKQASMRLHFLLSLDFYIFVLGSELFLVNQFLLLGTPV